MDEVPKKLERLKERYVMEEITKAMFDKYAGKLREEQQELDAALEKKGTRETLDIWEKNVAPILYS